MTTWKDFIDELESVGVNVYTSDPDSDEAHSVILTFPNARMFYLDTYVSRDEVGTIRIDETLPPNKSAARRLYHQRNK